MMKGMMLMIDVDDDADDDENFVNPVS